MTDIEGTIHRLWPVADEAIHDAVTAKLEGAELLIADGHPRYETARSYMAEVGGDGNHCYTLMSLTGLDDAGLTVYPTHQLLSGLAANADIRDHLINGIHAAFDVTETDRDGLDPAEMDGLGCFGFADGVSGRYYRLRLADPASLERLMPDRSEAYRQLDAAILEQVVLHDLLGLSEADVEAKKGLAYAHTVDEAIRKLDDMSHQAAFFMRATPIEQVRAVSGAGETMPPKSTFFYPKLLSGMAFNPLS